MNGNRLITNISYLFLSNVIVRFVTALSTVLVAKSLGAGEYGVLSVSLAFSTIAVYFTDLGLTHTLIREGTKKESNISVLMSSFLKVRIVLVLITIIISIFIFETAYTDPDLVKILYLVVLPTTLGTALQGIGIAYYQVIEKMHYTAIIQSITGLSTSLALIIGMIYDWNLLMIASMYGFANILAGIISLLMVMRKVNIFKGWEKSILTGLINFTISGIAIILLPQLAPLILEKVSNFKEVGFYSAAYRIPVVLYQLPAIVAVAFYPILFKFGNKKDFDNHFELSTLQIKLMSFFSVLLGMPFLIYSDWWITLLFGEEWIKAAATLKILSLVVITQSISYPIADALTTLGYQKKRMVVMLCGLILGVPSYYFLGNFYGSIGAAIGAIFIELFLLVFFVLLHPRGKRLLNNGFKYNGLGLILTLIISYSLLLKIDHFIGNIISVIIYVGIVFILDLNFSRKCMLWIKRRILTVNKFR
jgi:O-antigen/teichoic acid export membrane protein